MSRVTTAIMSYKDKIAELVKSVNFLYDNPVSAGAAADTQSVLAYAASLAIDFDQADPIRTLALTGNITFANALNKAAAKSKIIILTASGGTRTLTFPAGWVFLDQVAPSSLASGKTGILNLYCRGTAETDVIVSYSAQL